MHMEIEAVKKDYKQIGEGREGEGGADINLECIKLAHMCSEYRREDSRSRHAAAKDRHNVIMWDRKHTY